MNFIRMFNKVPHISDRNSWTKIYYKCYRFFQHSHDYWKKDCGAKITNMTIEEANKYIKDNRLDINISTILNYFDRRKQKINRIVDE